MLLWNVANASGRATPLRRYYEHIRPDCPTRTRITPPYERITPRNLQRSRFDPCSTATVTRPALNHRRLPPVTRNPPNHHPNSPGTSKFPLILARHFGLFFRPAMHRNHYVFGYELYHGTSFVLIRHLTNSDFYQIRRSITPPLLNPPGRKTTASQNRRSTMGHHKIIAQLPQATLYFRKFDSKSSSTSKFPLTLARNTGHSGIGSYRPLGI